MDLSFDLTTSQGRKNVLEVFERYGWAIPFVNGVWFTKKAIDWLVDPETDMIAVQTKSAKELIKWGRDNRLSSMRITLDQMAGIDFGSDVGGIPIRCKIGRSGHMEIHAEYDDYRPRSRRRRR